MPKKYIGYLIALLLLALAGLYGYYKWNQGKEKVDLWTIVPEDAVFIIETNRHENLIKELKRTTLWENVSVLPYFLSLQENLSLLDSAATRRVKLRSFLQHKKILGSFHVTSKTDFDFLLYVPVSSVSEHRYVRNVVENIGKSQIFTTGTEDYQGFEVTTIQNKQSSESFAFFTYRNNLIISPKTSLLHQVIRKINRSKLDSPIKEFKQTKFFRKRNLYARVFINYRQLSPLFNLLFKPELQKNLEYFSSLCSKSLLGIYLEKNEFFLEGLSEPESLAGSFYKNVNLQQIISPGIETIIPERTAALVHFGRKYSSQVLSGSVHPLASRFSPEVLSLVDSLRFSFQEAAICFLAPENSTDSTEKVVLAYAPDVSKTSAFLQKINQVTNTRLSAKRAGSFFIQEIGVPELPGLLFQEGFTGFGRCFTAQVKNYTVFAPTEVILRRYIQDIRDKDVLEPQKNNSPNQKTAMPDANFRWYINLNNSWELLNRWVNEDKKAGLLRHENFLKKLNEISLVYAGPNTPFKTRLLLHQSTESISTEPVNKDFVLENELNFPEPIITGLNLLQVPSTLQNELVVQDTSFVLHLLSTKGQISWSDSLESRVTSKIFPITFGSGDQPKYAFATSNRIYCVDQNGRDAENFPFNIGDSIAVEGLSVFNRENNLGVHFLVYNARGDVFLFDAKGNILPGWSPKNFPGKLATEPVYVNIKGRELILFLLENGFVYALDTNGLNYPGFPINLRGSFHSPLISLSGDNFRNYEFTTLSEAGNLITFNLLGQVEKRIAFARPSRRTSFQLIPENSGKSFLIARQNLGRLSLFDASQNLVMEKSYVTSAPKQVQYFYFNPANVVYAITESGPGKTYLYDINVKLIGNKPIQNKLPVQVRFNPYEQQYELYKVSGATFQQLNFTSAP